MGRRLRFPAEGDVIVEVEEIEPGFHVLARLLNWAMRPANISTVSTSLSGRRSEM